MKKHYETHVEDTDKLISVAGPVLDYKSWYEQYRKLMEEQAQRKYGLYTPTSEGDDDDFPSIPGMIARYSALGLTNEQMAENPVWKDLTGNGHDLQMKNFGWARMSGVGGYSTRQSVYKFTPDIYTMICVGAGATHMSFTFKVTGLKPDTNLTLMYAGTSGQKIYGKWTEDGIYSVDSEIEHVGQPVYFYNGYGSIHDTFTIEIFPLYPGFILGDGVDDFAVTEKELNFQDTYTVYTAFIPFQNDPARNMILCGKNEAKDFSINYSGTHINFKPSKGVNLAPHINQFMLLVCKRNKDITTIINLSTGESNSLSSEEFIANPGLYYLWRNVTAIFYARAAIAGQTICNGYFSTDEDDEKVLNYYKQEYPWLFPDQAWTVTGKTNEDEDRATIANITGNGNDLVLSNFGFIEGSGYNEEGEYAGYLVTDGVDDKIQSSAFTMGKDFTVVGEWVFMGVDSINYAGFIKDSSFILYNYFNYGEINVYIKSLSGYPVKSKTLKGFSSNGQVYIDFNNLKEIKYGDSVALSSMLNIGYNPNNESFTKLAFKNLAIYPTVLSKEDCIKAYNYLQTLKAK